MDPCDGLLAQVEETTKCSFFPESILSFLVKENILLPAYLPSPPSKLFGYCQVHY